MTVEYSAPGGSPHSPKIARLFASVAPLVKITSSGNAPKQFATVSRASSSDCRARRPAACDDDGLPNASVINGRIASIASGKSGVVALWSK